MARLAKGGKGDALLYLAPRCWSATSAGLVVGAGQAGPASRASRSVRASTPAAGIG